MQLRKYPQQKKKKERKKERERNHQQHISVSIRSLNIPPLDNSSKNAF